jgi:hypothetical protein
VLRSEKFNSFRNDTSRVAHYKYQNEVTQVTKLLYNDDNDDDNGDDYDDDDDDDDNNNNNNNVNGAESFLRS